MHKDLDRLPHMWHFPIKEIAIQFTIDTYYCSKKEPFRNIFQQDFIIGIPGVYMKKFILLPAFFLVFANLSANVNSTGNMNSAGSPPNQSSFGQSSSNLNQNLNLTPGPGTYNQRQPTAENISPDEEHPQDRFATENDREINKKIRDKITGWFTDDYKTISISTNNGHTVIDGSVDSADDRTYLVDEVRKYFPEASVNVQVRP